MKILHICESYPPHYGGGAAVYAADICRELARRGHEVRVLTTEGSDHADYTVRADSDGDIPVSRVTLNRFARLDPEGWSLGLGGYRRHEAAVDAVIRSEVAVWRPDIVNLHTTRPFGEQQFFTLRSLGLPVVVLAHEAWLVCMRLMLLRSPYASPCDGPGVTKCAMCLYTHYDGNRGPMKLPWRWLRQGALPLYRLRRRALARRQVNLVIAYSRFMAKVLEPDLACVRHISLGITHPSPSPARPPRPRAPFRFGFFAGGQPSKGLEDVLSAARSLLGKSRPFELHIWGPDASRISQLIAGAGAEDFALFRGSYGVDDMWTPYEEVDAAVMATRVLEPFGRIPQEAALAGIPSIVPAVGGLAEQIRHGEDGLLFAFRNETDLARQMQRVLDEPGLYERLASHLWAVRDTRDAVGEIEHAYSDCVAKAAGRTTPPGGQNEGAANS